MNTLKLNLLEQGRATEWITSFVLLGFAYTLALPGETLDSPAFRAFREIGADDATVAMPLAMIAVARICALYINGNWHRSPMLRMVGAILGFTVFAMLAAAFYWPRISIGSPQTTGVTTYLFLAAADALSIYRSAADVRLGKQLSNRV